MKEKIRKTINQTVGELAAKMDTAEPNSAEYVQASENLSFLKQQINLLPQAQISTFHAFALEVIRKYFYIIDVEPNFKICDDAQQVILRTAAMDELLEELFEEEDPAFLQFLACYSGDRNENRFREMIEKVYSTIQALPEPYVWLHEKVEMLRSGTEESLKPLLDFLWQLAEIHWDPKVF